jgi:hypothetical protein
MERGLLARAAEFAERYEELATEADWTAVRWRWATPESGRGDVEPLRPERLGRAPGRWLHRPPPPWQQHEAIGFDALGRVVCVREYDATGEVGLERFAAWTRDAVEVACFRAPLDGADGELPAELQSLVRMRLAFGEPLDSERYLAPTGSWERERYRHEGGRLARVEEESSDGAAVVKEVVYGEDGRVAGIDALGPDGRHAVWRHGGTLVPPCPPGRAVRSARSAASAA